MYNSFCGVGYMKMKHKREYIKEDRIYRIILLRRTLTFLIGIPYLQLKYIIYNIIRITTKRMTELLFSNGNILYAIM